MILDSSVVVAILRREPGHDGLLAALAADPWVAIGAPTATEAGIVLTARVGTSARTLLARFVAESGVEIVPFGEEHWLAAVAAFARFGKGRHAAGLNFGDCLAYATARLADEPLLSLGDEFARTDVVLARRPR